MATLITPEKFDSLIAEAKPLYEKALGLARGISVRPELSPLEVDLEHHVNTAAIAIQAILAGSPFNDRGIASILGAVFGNMLAQVEDKEEVVMAFWSQAGSTTQEVEGALRPRGEC